MEFYTNVVLKNNKLLVRGYKDGKRFWDTVNYSPKLYTPSKTPTKFRTIDGSYVSEVSFDTPNAMWQYINQYKDVAGFDYYGLEDVVYQFINGNYSGTTFDPAIIQTCILDIEVDTEGGYPDIDSANKTVTAITLLYKNITFALGYGDYTPPESHIKYIKCKSEEDLLEKFLKIWESEIFCPDVVSGWNIELFDIPYLFTRIRRVLSDDDAKRLSPYGKLQQRTIKIFGKDHKAFFPSGIAILDYLSLYKKFVAVSEPQESYRLDHIAWVELKHRKLDYSEYGNLHTLAKNDHQKFMEYNILDCELVAGIEAKRQLFNLVYTVAYRAGVNYADAIGSVKLWDVMIHNYLLSRGMVIPKKKQNPTTHSLAGGYVKDPLRGRYDWVVSFDLTSLYPHLIMQYNIGPDTYAGQLKQSYTPENIIAGKHNNVMQYLSDNNLSMAANSCLYRRDKESFLSSLMKDLFKERKQVKDEMLALKQENEAIKQILQKDHGVRL